MLRVIANLKLLYKLLIPIAVLVVATGGIVLTATGALGTLSAATNDVIDHTAARLAYALEVESAVNDAGVSEKNVLMESDPDEMKPYRDRYQAAVAKALAASDALLTLADTEARKARGAAVKAAVAEFDAAAQRSIGFALNNEVEAAMKMTHTKVTETRSKLQQLVEAMVAVNREEMGAAKASMGDVERSVMAQLYGSAAVGLLVSLAILGWVVLFQVVRPLTAMTGAMQSLAEGRLETEVVGLERRDEVGTLARSLQVFKENAGEAERMRLEQERLKEESAAQQRTALERVAQVFEQNVGDIVGVVASSAQDIQKAAQSLSETAEETTRQASTVSAAAGQATTNVQTVAAASEELSASISEIARQVTDSSRIAQEAVQQANRTNSTVQGLAAAAQKIGEVVNLIQTIAGQTNLLALNATIEAARAGDAGKGFAVVASEVKSLANQTAKATDEIKAQIDGIQTATGETVTAIQSIGATIAQINEIATTIASAVEQQGAATREIAGNVQQAAQGTDEVSSTITSVNAAANETGAAATQVLGVAGALSSQSERLKEEVVNFLGRLRSAA